MKRFDITEVNLSIGSGRYFWLEEGFRYQTDYMVRSIFVRPFKTDLATIPWYVQWRLKRLGKYNLPAIVHDYLLQHRDLFPELDRLQIDLIFKEAMRDMGVPDFECRWLYRGVRLNSILKEWFKR